MDHLENSIRIKITGRCNRNCFFCHKEGGMNEIDELYFTPELGTMINRLYSDFHINAIAITGGEPILHSDLETLLQEISSKTRINKFSLTTNGTVIKEKSYWKALKESGLYKVNLSISDILSSIKASETQSEKSVFENQLQTIAILNELDIVPNINIVVYNDEKYSFNLLNALFKQEKIKFEIALLPNLTNEHTFAKSQSVIKRIIEYYGCKKMGASHRKGTSNTVCEYITNTGHYLQVKTTKLNGNPQWLNSLCSECKMKKHCQEGFYGLRLESREKQLMIRLCLYKSDESVLMDLKSFENSYVYKELKEAWK